MISFPHTSTHENKWRDSDCYVNYSMYIDRRATRTLLLSISSGGGGGEKGRGVNNANGTVSKLHLFLSLRVGFTFKS